MQELKHAQPQIAHVCLLRMKIDVRKDSCHVCTLAQKRQSTRARKPAQTCKVHAKAGQLPRGFLRQTGRDKHQRPGYPARQRGNHAGHPCAIDGKGIATGKLLSSAGKAHVSRPAAHMPHDGACWHVEANTLLVPRRVSLEVREADPIKKVDRSYPHEATPLCHKSVSHLCDIEYLMSQR